MRRFLPCLTLFLLLVATGLGMGFGVAGSPTTHAPAGAGAQHGTPRMVATWIPPETTVTMRGSPFPCGGQAGTNGGGTFGSASSFRVSSGIGVRPSPPHARAIIMVRYFVIAPDCPRFPPTGRRSIGGVGRTITFLSGAGSRALRIGTWSQNGDLFQVSAIGVSQSALLRFIGGIRAR
jgi:hypothetical protein